MTPTLEQQEREIIEWEQKHRDFWLECFDAVKSNKTKTFLIIFNLAVLLTT